MLVATFPQGCAGESTRYSPTMLLDPADFVLDPPECRLALVVGNAAYEFAGRLRNPANDAHDMATALTELGFDVSLKTNLARPALLAEVHRFLDKAAAHSLRLFYYAGHGIQVDGENYLVPTDANPTSSRAVEYDCIPLGRILGPLHDLHPGVNLVVLDACRDNPFARRWRTIAAPRGLAPVSAPEGSLICYATAPGEVASDGDGRNGVYTGALLRRLTLDLEISQVMQRVRRDVRSETDRAQIPWEATSLVGDVRLADEAVTTSRRLAEDGELGPTIRGCLALDERIKGLRKVETLYPEESTEGAGVDAYYDGSQLRKLAYTECWESGKAESAFYLDETGAPLLLAERFSRYNVPFTFTEEVAREVGTDEWFDESKTKVEKTFTWIAPDRVVARQHGDCLEADTSPDRTGVNEAFEKLLSMAAGPSDQNSS